MFPSCDAMTLHGDFRFEMSVDSMTNGFHNNNNCLAAPLTGQLQIDSSGQLCAGTKGTARNVYYKIFCENKLVCHIKNLSSWATFTSPPVFLVVIFVLQFHNQVQCCRILVRFATDISVSPLFPVTSARGRLCSGCIRPCANCQGSYCRLCSVTK